MSVSPVNFFLQDTYTQDGRKYKNSNIAKTIIPVMLTPVMVAKLKNISKPKQLLKSVPKSKLAQTIFKRSKTLFKSNKAMRIASVIGTVLAAIGLGTLIDGVISKSTEVTSFKGLESDEYRCCKNIGRSVLDAHQG